MLRLFPKLSDSSTFENIVLVLFSVFALRAFGCTTRLEDQTFRLPRDVRPISYVLQFHPDFDTELFNGEVIIDIEILCERQFIVLHAKDLTIVDTRIVALKRFNETAVVIDELATKRVFAIDEFDMIIVETTKIILPGTYEISMKFNGTMKNENRGLFVTSYFDPDTESTRKMVTNRFQPTHARRAFPCFDEPGFRAIFNIRLVQPTIDGYHSLSNMPSEFSMPESPMPGLTTVYFEPTLPMPTHMVTFVISDLVYTTAIVANVWDVDRQTILRAWTTEDKMISSDLVLHAAYQAVNVYTRLFGIDCPLPKIDLVAIPRFVSGSNENRGLGKFDEGAMLFYDRVNSVTDLKISTNKITNELVRIWFGNLVGMEWWSDFWLVESFATYMQYYATEDIFPDWKETATFVIDAEYPSMTRDALISSEPIVQPADSNEKIEHLFDAMSDKKGASIIRMLHYMMGERNFFSGIASYLQLYQYRTTVTDDFLKCLQEYHTIKEDLVRFVGTWTRQSGFPVLNVVRSGNIYFINQTRFLVNNVNTHAPTDSPYSYKWDLPIFYTTDLDNSLKRVFMSYETNEAELVVDEQVRWVKFNTNSAGYYTVNYDEQSWNFLSTVLRTQPKEFGLLDRTDLLHDAFVNADADTLPYDVPMTMLACMKFETEYVPWQLVCDRLLKMHTMLRGTLSLRKFEVFVGILIKRIYLLIGWKPRPADTFELRRLRMIILKIACAVGLKDCLDEVTEKFRYWIKSPNARPHPDIKDVVYYYGMAIAGKYVDWRTVYDLFTVESNLQERRKLMISLTAVKNASLLLTYLQIAKHPTIMNRDEYLTTIRAATSNPMGPRIIWNYYRLNWSFLTSRYSRNDREFARLIVPVTSRFRNAYRLVEFRNFFDASPYGKLSEVARREALETVENNAFWMEKNYNDIKIWLNTYRLRDFDP